MITENNQEDLILMVGSTGDLGGTITRSLLSKGKNVRILVRPQSNYHNKFEPFDNQKLQTLLYLNSNFSETSSLEEKECFEVCCEKKAWIINIKDKVTLESIKIFQGYQTKEAEDFLNKNISRFALLALGKLEPKHHNNSKKCRSCRFEECEDYL
jgi:hypothetical protein